MVERDPGRPADRRARQKLLHRAFELRWRVSTRDRPATRIRTLTAIGNEATARPRFRAVLIGTFALLALVLAMVGVFGVLAYSVQQRTREFGVRIALGASATNVLGLVLGSAARVIGTGVVIGLVLAFAFAQSVASFLFGVQPRDPVTFGVSRAGAGADGDWWRVRCPRCERCVSIRLRRFEVSDDCT